MDEFLKQIRAKMGLSQRDFAEHFGIPVRTVQEWEQGRRIAPPYVTNLIFRVMVLERQLEYERMEHQKALADAFSMDSEEEKLEEVKEGHSRM